MNERKTIHGWWWAWNFDKEEQWLNEMAMEGWALYDRGFCVYHFEKTEPGEYMIRLEMHKPDYAYEAFMEETGAQHVAARFNGHISEKKQARAVLTFFPILTPASATWIKS